MRLPNNACEGSLTLEASCCMPVLTDSAGSYRQDLGFGLLELHDGCTFTLATGVKLRRFLKACEPLS